MANKQPTEPEANKQPTELEAISDLLREAAEKLRDARSRAREADFEDKDLVREVDLLAEEALDLYQQASGLQAWANIEGRS